MPTVNHKGGFIYLSTNRDVYSGVDNVEVTQIHTTATANWIVTLEDVPKERNYTIGDDLTYNAKGTKNDNSNNSLNVQDVLGPTKYSCLGNWPINI